MSTPINDAAILAVWYEVDDEYDDDVSTHRLLEITASRCRCSLDRVCDALQRASEAEGKKGNA